MGNCYDGKSWGNAQDQCASKHYPSPVVARQVMFEYIEVWYNRRLRHSALDYLITDTFCLC